MPQTISQPGTQAALQASLAVSLAPTPAQSTATQLAQAIGGSASTRGAQNNLTELDSANANTKGKLSLTALTGKAPVNVANLVYAQSLASAP